MLEIINENLSLFLSSFVGIAVFLILLFVYLRDLEVSKRLNRMEDCIDSINKEIYKLCKNQKNYELQSKYTEASIKTQLNEMLNNTLANVYAQIDSMNNLIKSEKSITNDEISQLGEKIKDLEFFSSSTNSIDERRIISLYQDGSSIENIARELGIGKGEVELTLKLSKID